MTAHDFDVLAAKVLAGEATAEETTRLQAALAQDAELRNEFDDLHKAWQTLKTVGPLAEAFDAPPATPPPKRLREWQSTVEEQFSVAPSAAEMPQKQVRERVGTIGFGAWIRAKLGVPAWGFAGVGLALVLTVALLLPRRPDATVRSTVVAYLVVGKNPIELRQGGKVVTVDSGAPLRESDEIRLTSEVPVTVITPAGARSIRGPGRFNAAQLAASSAVATNGQQTNGTFQMVHTALFESPQQMRSLLVTMRSSGGLPIYSPRGFTANLTPVILWKGDPGKFYDLVIADEFSPAAVPMRQTGVTSPVEFTNAWPGRSLSSDGLYRIRITENGNPIVTSEVTFRTLPQTIQTLSIAPAESLSAAYQMLIADPPRFGDALAILLTLPPKSAESELALRLKLVAFGRLGYQDDFQTILSRIEASR